MNSLLLYIFSEVENIKFFPKIISYYFLNRSKNDTFQKNMALFFYEYYEAMKDYFHPNVHSFIHRYTDDEGLVSLLSFHGCELKNRNGSRKLIHYRNGKQCLCPVWSDDNSKLKGSLFPITRYMTQGKERYLFKNKGKETAFLIIR